MDILNPNEITLDSINNDILDFIKNNNINLQEVIVCVSNIKKNLPLAEFEFDIESYNQYGVLRLLIKYDNKNIQPRLFGTLANLASLNDKMWKDATENWTGIMENISNYGTFLKKGVLIPNILSLIRKYYKKGSKIIDVGCGEGVLIEELLKEFVEIYGIDGNHKFIKHLKVKYPIVSNNFNERDLLYIDDSKTFDIVICSMLMLDIPDINTALDRIFHILNANGILIIADINSKYYQALGYIQGEILIKIQNETSIFHTEKMIDGHTKAVHNYHPFNYYRQYLKEIGLECLEDFELGVKKDDILNSKDLKEVDKQHLIEELRIEFNNPSFHILVFRKKA